MIVLLLVDKSHITEERANSFINDFENSDLAAKMELCIVDAETRDETMEGATCIVVHHSLFKNQAGAYTKEFISKEEERILRCCLFKDNKRDRSVKYDPALLRCFCVTDRWLNKSIRGGSVLPFGDDESYDITFSVALAMRQLPVVTLSHTLKSGEERTFDEAVICRDSERGGYRTVSYVINIFEPLFDESSLTFLTLRETFM
jgi:hypothetical protein